MFVHPRTLESLRPLGVTDSLLERAERAPQAELHVGRRRVRGPPRRRGRERHHLPAPHPAAADGRRGGARRRPRRSEGSGSSGGSRWSTLRADDDAAHATLRTAGSGRGDDLPVPRGLRRPDQHRAHGGGHRLAGRDLHGGGRARRRRARRGPRARRCCTWAVGRDGLVFLFALGESERPGACSPPVRRTTAADRSGSRVPGLPAAEVQDLLDATASRRHGRRAGAGRRGCGSSTGSPTPSGRAGSSWPGTPRTRTPPPRPRA